jgi:hypothetical protein
MRNFTLALLCLTLLAALPSSAAAPQAAVSLTAPYTQNFNTLAASGAANAWGDDSTLPGWYTSRVTYIADAGSSNTGGLHSHGASGSSERALGSLGSNSAGTIYYGVRLVNDTGSAISALTVSYTGEQWRDGGNTTQQALIFEYQIGASVSLTTTGGWIPVSSLVFTGPIATGTAGALNGNDPANRVSLAAVIGMSLPVGQEIMLRWTDVNDSGNDHSLAIDDLVVSAGGTPPDLPPAVASADPASGTTDVAVGTSIAVNFSEPVMVTGSWYTIHCASSGAHTAAVSGGPIDYVLSPDVPFAQTETCTVTIYAAQVVDQDGTADQMAANHVWSFTTYTPPSACSTIPQIQGSGNTSPCLGYRSNVVGCVTGVTATGFYFQDELGDGDPATSDGIYAYYYSTWKNPSNLKPGDRVRVAGNVTEYYDTTEFAHSGGAALSVTRIGACTAPTPVVVTPVADPTADPMALYERYEGMRVQMSFHGWVVGPTKRFDSRFPAGDPEIAFVDFSSSIPAYSRVFERDFAGYQGIVYISGGLNQDLPDVDFGDEISGAAITGVLGYQFDKYTLLVDTAPTLTAVDRPDVTTGETAANTAAGEFDICFANVENLFDNCNDGLGDWGDWAPGYAVTPGLAVGSCEPTGLAAYQAKLAKVAGVFVNQTESCMALGLTEMEGKQGVYDALAAAMHTLDAGRTWTAGFVLSGDPRNITQGFLWRNDVTLVDGVTVVSGAPYTGWLAPAPDNNGVLDFVRDPATGLFRFNAGTANQVDIRLYAVHFKSKRSSASCLDPDCTDVRKLEAADMRDILAHHQAAGERAIGGGDFNDTFGSSPIAILDGSASIESLYDNLGTRERYSYIFNGESEVLDHFYVTANLLPGSPGWGQVFHPVHANADFPSSEHASDHDPLRARFVPCPTAAAEAPSSLGISRNLNANGVDLAWAAAANAARYQVWRDAAPYFTPAGSPLDAASTPGYTDPNVLGNPAANQYYVTIGVNACGAASAVSNRVGAFSFALMPGQ